MATRTLKAKGCLPDQTLRIEQSSKETDGEALARILMEPGLRHALVASALTQGTIGGGLERPALMDFVGQVKGSADKAAAGDLAIASRMLAAQAVALDSLFTELLRRAALNMGEHIGAAETYSRLALKAQGNCRTTLEALAKLHQPREQTVRHVHVNQGGQALVADSFHHHTGGNQNGNSDEQSHAPGPLGSIAALPCHDAQGLGMPVASREREAALQNARGNKSGGAQG